MLCSTRLRHLTRILYRLEIRKTVIRSVTEVKLSINTL